MNNLEGLSIFSPPFKPYTGLLNRSRMVLGLVGTNSGIDQRISLFISPLRLFWRRRGPFE